MDLLAAGLIALAAYWTGWAVGRHDRPEPPPWPEVEDVRRTNLRAGWSAFVYRGT